MAPLRTRSLLLSCAICAGAAAQDGLPRVLDIRERVAVVNAITRQRLDELLPRIMRETDFDMWIIACNEDNLDPVFETMIPMDTWCPITQILVLFDRGPEEGVARLNVSRTNMKGLHEPAWDARAWDRDETESQWDCLARIVRECDPRRIAINEAPVQWAADGMTVTLKKRLVDAIGPDYAARLASAEPLATLWLETLLDEEIPLYEHAVAISHALIAEMFSREVITPGVTTLEDITYHYWQRAASLGLSMSFLPHCCIRARDPDVESRYGKDERVVRPGDLLHCDVGLRYLRYHTDHQELAYVLRPGERDVPEGFKVVLAAGNRLQDVFCGEFRTGLTGNELLANILAKARAEGIPNPRIYSHSVGYCLHEPGPLIGLPWEQEHNPGRGDVALVPNSCFTAELSVRDTVPELGGAELQLGIEQIVAFTGSRVLFLDGRQTAFHVID